MKIVEGNFGKKESTGRSMREKLEEALKSVGPEIDEPNDDVGFILITDVDSNVYVASDLPAETFNFLLDTAKMNVLLSTTVSVE